MEYTVAYSHCSLRSYVIHFWEKKKLARFRVIFGDNSG